MANNVFNSTIASSDPIFKSALMAARYGRQYDENDVNKFIKPLGSQAIRGGFELADAVEFGQQLKQVDPTQIATRFASQLQRPMFGGDLDLSKQQASVNIADLVSGDRFKSQTIGSTDLSLQNLISARTDFSRNILDQIRGQTQGTRLSELGPEATAQAFIESIKKDPESGDPTATFSGLEGAPSLSYSELQSQADDPFAKDVLRRIRDFTNTFDSNNPDTPIGQSAEILNDTVSATVASSEADLAKGEVNALGTSSYDDAELRAQLAEQSELLKTLSDRLSGMSSTGASADSGRLSSADLTKLLGDAFSQQRGDVSELLAASREGRISEEDVSNIINQQLMQADIRGQVGEAVKTEFGDVFTEQMVNRSAREQEQFDSLLAMLGERQAQDERMARDQWTRQDAIRSQQEEAVSGTIRDAEQAGRLAYSNVRGLPIVQTDFSATDPLRQSVQDAIMERVKGTGVDAIKTERLAQLDEEADTARQALTEKLNRLGVLRRGGDVTDVLGEFEGQVLRGKQGIESDIEILRQNLIGQGIASGTDFRGQETNTELFRTQQLANQLSASRDLELRRNALQQDVADRTLARGLTRLGPTERERFENQLRGQQQSEYLARSEFAQRAEQSALDREFSSAENLAHRDFQEEQAKLQRELTSQQASMERGLRKFELNQSTAQQSAARRLQRDLADQQTNLAQQRIDIDTESEASRSSLARDEFERSIINDATQRSQYDRQLAQSRAEAERQREFGRSEAALVRNWEFDKLIATQEAADSRSSLDRQLQLDLQENASTNAESLESLRNEFNASESGLGRELQRDMMRSDREQMLAERNLRESESRLDRLHQTNERTSQQNFHREQTSQEHAQRQSDRTLQRDLAKGEIDATANLARLQRTHEENAAADQRFITRELAELDREHASDEALAQRGFLSRENLEDRYLQRRLTEMDHVFRAAETEEARTFQRSEAALTRGLAREQNRFTSQQAQLDREFAENESNRQRGFIRTENYGDRQHQIFLSREQLAADKESQEDQRVFAREQNRFIANQAQLDREQQELESARQRGFISNESFQDRQNQIYLARQDIQAERSAANVRNNFAREQNRFISQQAELDRQFTSEEASLSRNEGYSFQREQNRWQAQQSSLDRQAAENESLRQRGFISDQNYADRQHQIYIQRTELESARNDAEAQRHFITQENWSDRQNQILLTDRTLADNAQNRAWQSDEARTGRDFAREQNRFTSQQADLDRQAVELENNRQRGFISDQNYNEQQNRIYLERMRLDQSRELFDEQNRFNAEQNATDRSWRAEQSDLDRTQQDEQYERTQGFNETQAERQARLHAIGQILAAEEGGIELGFGMGSAAPGGSAGLLRDEINRSLGRSGGSPGGVEAHGQGSYMDEHNFRGFLYGEDLGTGAARLQNLENILFEATRTEGGLVHPEFSFGQMAAIEQEVSSVQQQLEDKIRREEEDDWWPLW